MSIWKTVVCTKGVHAVQDFAVRCTKHKVRFEKFIKGTETTHWFAWYGSLVENDVVCVNAILLWTHGKQIWLCAFFNGVQVLLYVSPGLKRNKKKTKLQTVLQLTLSTFVFHNTISPTYTDFRQTTGNDSKEQIYLFEDDEMFFCLRCRHLSRSLSALWWRRDQMK